MENLFFCFFKHEKLPVTEYTHPYTNPAPMHSHNFFEFLVPIEGKIENSYKETTQTLSPGELLLLRPNDEHALSVPNNTKHLHRDIYVWPDKMQKICATLSADLYDKIMSANKPLYFNVGMKKLQILQEQLNRFDLEKADIIDYESYHTCIVFELLGFYIDHQIQHISYLPEWLQTLLSLLNQPEVMALPIDELQPRLCLRCIQALHGQIDREISHGKQNELFRDFAYRYRYADFEDRHKAGLRFAKQFYP